MRASEHPFQGITGAHIESPTRDIPSNCMCTWVVVRPGMAGRCVSRLKYRNALCPHRHVASAPAVPEGLAGLPGADDSGEDGKQWVRW